MHRIRLALAGLIVVGTGMVLGLLPARAQAEAVVIDGISVWPYADSASITWTTDVTATSTLAYGTQPGTYTNEATTSSGISHQVQLTGLAENTRHYFKITATDIDDKTGETDEQTFVTETKDLTIKSVQTVTAGSDKIIVEVKLNQGARVTLKYGLTADDLDQSANQLIVTSGTGAVTWPFVLKNLKASTTYYVQATATQAKFWHGRDATVTSDVQSVQTSGKPKITSVKPRTGKNGTRVVIKGENFGSAPSNGTTGIIALGCKLGNWPESYPLCMTRAKDLISWSDTKIVFKVNKKMSTGRVYVGKAYKADGSEVIFAIRGPKFVKY